MSRRLCCQGPSFSYLFLGWAAYRFRHLQIAQQSSRVTLNTLRGLHRKGVAGNNEQNSPASNPESKS